MVEVVIDLIDFLNTDEGDELVRLVGLVLGRVEKLTLTRPPKEVRRERL